MEARKAAVHANGTRELLLNCAAAEFFAGDLRKATRMAENILKKEPDYPPALTLLAAAHALAGHAGRSTECLQRLWEKGLQLRSQILPVIEKLRKAGKKDEADRLLSLLDWQPQAVGPDPAIPGPESANSRHRALWGSRIHGMPRGACPPPEERASRKSSWIPFCGGMTMTKEGSGD